MKKLLCFWICLCLGFLGEVQAQAIWAKDFPFAGGLPTNEMTTIYQDRDGFIWVGTTNGLVRYDGYHVRLFQRDGSLVSGLTDNRITQMAEDSLWLWVGTSAGLNLIHRNTYQVSAFPEESLGKGYINSLCSDGENTVWVGTDNQVLVFRAPSLHPVDTITLASREGKRAVVNKILRDRTGRLWICTRAGLFLHEPSTNRLCHLPPVGESDNLSSVCQDRDGRLWVASWGEGLWQIVADRNFRDVRYVFHPVESFQKGAGESRFFDVEQDDVCGYLWALSYDRLYAFRITPAGALEQVELPFYVDAEKMYTRILKDRDGNLWLSSYDRGALLTFHGETVRDVPLSGFAEALGKRPNLLTLTLDGRGRFWFVQDRFGLCLHDPSDGSTVLASQDVRRVTVDVRVVAESPSERRVSMYAESPASRICSPARSRGPGFTSMASTRGQIPRCTSQIEVNPWSQPTSAATLPRSTSRADIKSRSDSSISRFLPAISPDSPSACGCGWDDGAFSAPSPRSAGSAHGSR